MAETGNRSTSPIVRLPGMAEQIGLLARDSGIAITDETDLKDMLEGLAQGTGVKVPLMLALGEILSEIFRYENRLDADDKKVGGALTLPKED
jgi:type III secretion system FlhB-like substrate exporter